jgi:hypothetical protein
MNKECLAAGAAQRNTDPLETNPRFQLGMISILGDPNNGI